MLIAIFYEKLFTKYCPKTGKTAKSIYKSISTSPISKCLITTITKTNIPSIFMHSLVLPVRILVGFNTVLGVLLRFNEAFAGGLDMIENATERAE